MYLPISLVMAFILQKIVGWDAFWVSTIVILLMLVWRDIYSILVSSLLPHFFMFAIIQ